MMMIDKMILKMSFVPIDNSLSIAISITIRIYFEPTLLSYECGVRFSLFEVFWNQVAAWVRMA